MIKQQVFILCVDVFKISKLKQIYAQLLSALLTSVLSLSLLFGCQVSGSRLEQVEQSPSATNQPRSIISYTHILTPFQEINIISKTTLFETIPISSNFSIDPNAEYLFDDIEKRGFVIGQIDGAKKILVLDQMEGHLLTMIDSVGKPALDSIQQRLYIDEITNGLTILNAQTGQALGHIPLPVPADVNSSPPTPIFLPETGKIVAFRDSTIFVIDPESQAIQQTVDVPIEGVGMQMAPISQATYDWLADYLYVGGINYYVTSVASGSFTGFEMVAFSLPDFQEQFRFDAGGNKRMAANGYWFESEFTCHGGGIVCDGALSVHRESQSPIKVSGKVDFTSGFAYDDTRNKLYETNGLSLRVYNADTMQLLQHVSLPQPGKLIRYNAASDSLDILSGSKIIQWPVSDIRPPLPKALTHSTVPTTAVSTIIVSPNWSNDSMLMAIWQEPEFPDNAPFDNSTPSRSACIHSSQLYLSRDRGQSWSQMTNGVMNSCGLSDPATIIYDENAQPVLYSGVPGLGLFKSTDLGQLWLPSWAAATPVRFRQLHPAPGFAKNQTIFISPNELLSANDSFLWYTTDGGETWQTTSPLSMETSAELDLFDLSPEFDQDHTIIAAATHYNSPSKIYISSDRGQHWAHLNDLPKELVQIVIAPLFNKWQTIFALSKTALYRSQDGGQTWHQIIVHSSVGTIKQLVYAENIEEGRPLFLLADTVYLSTDGGLSWQPVPLPITDKPSALAISPSFAQDCTLFIGTETGQVIYFVVDGFAFCS